MTISPDGASPNPPAVAPAPNSRASAHALVASRLVTSTECPALAARPPIDAAIPPDPIILIVPMFLLLASFEDFFAFCVAPVANGAGTLYLVDQRSIYLDRWSTYTVR